MFLVSWTEFNINGNTYCCRHLRTTEHDIEIDGTTCKLKMSYSHHCFTDKTDSGPRLFKDGRSWSQERYEESINLPNIMENALNTGYCIPHYHYNNEQYHYLESSDYAIFFNINKPLNTTNELKIKINSAYPLATWGKGTLPKGKAKLIRWVLSQRVQGLSILKKK